MTLYESEIIFFKEIFAVEIVEHCSNLELLRTVYFFSHARVLYQIHYFIQPVDGIIFYK